VPIAAATFTLHLLGARFATRYTLLPRAPRQHPTRSHAPHTLAHTRCHTTRTSITTRAPGDPLRCLRTTSSSLSYRLFGSLRFVVCVLPATPRYLLRGCCAFAGRPTHSFKTIRALPTFHLPHPFPPRHPTTPPPGRQTVAGAGHGSIAYVFMIVSTFLCLNNFFSGTVVAIFAALHARRGAMSVAVNPLGCGLAFGVKILTTTLLLCPWTMLCLHTPCAMATFKPLCVCLPLPFLLPACTQLPPHTLPALPTWVHALHDRDLGHSIPQNCLPMDYATFYPVQHTSPATTSCSLDMGPSHHTQPPVPF